MSATEAARNFADLLDKVERTGETFTVVRRGSPVATIGPARVTSGRALLDALDKVGPDAGWTEDLRELRSGIGPAPDRWEE